MVVVVWCILVVVLCVVMGCCQLVWWFWCYVDLLSAEAVDVGAVVGIVVVVIVGLSDGGGDGELWVV